MLEGVKKVPSWMFESPSHSWFPGHNEVTSLPAVTVLLKPDQWENPLKGKGWEEKSKRGR